MQQSVNIGMKGTQQFPAQMKGHIPRKQKKIRGMVLIIQKQSD